MSDKLDGDLKTQRPLDREFSFAGFDFPKYVWTLPHGGLRKRLERARGRCTGDYYHAPKPEHAGRGKGFYLSEDDGSQIALRWEWADKVEGVRIRNKGWYCDAHMAADKIRGLVFRLPKGRGFLAGWSMGEGMASSVDCDIYDTIAAAAYAADRLAEIMAEKELELAEAEALEVVED
jgi:hypothetical protein